MEYRTRSGESYLQPLSAIRGARKLKLLLFVAVAACATSATNALLFSADQAALRSIAAHWPILQTGVNAWSATDAQQACEIPWRGVNCSLEGTGLLRVLQLDLSNEKLTNLEVPALFTLDALQMLDLTNATLMNSVPNSWSSLSNLTTLRLGQNQLSGPIPDSIGSMPLQNLHLDANRFTGNIPDSFQDLANLVSLNISFNSVTGSFLDWVARFPLLEVLSAAATKLRPSIWQSPISFIKVPYAISPDIANCTLLRHLDLRFTNSYQDLPDELGQLQNLEEFYFNFATNFPNTSQWDSIRVLHLAMTAPMDIPDSLGELVTLKELVLTGGHNVPVPASVGMLSNLALLSMARMGLVGTIPATWAGMTNLRELLLSQNGIEGLLPIDYWPQIEHVDVSSNKFDTLPAVGPAGGELQWLYLTQNSFSGALPDWVGSSTTLRILSITSNGFTSIPSTIGQLSSSLTMLMASANPIQSLPVEFGDLNQLSGLDLCGSNFSSMPFNTTTNGHSSLWDILTRMSALRTLVLVGVNIHGSIPPSIGQLTQLENLQLSKNFITGDLPIELATGPTMLSTLMLADNLLNGTLPTWLGSMASLARLDLTHNQLTGPLPPELAEMKIQILQLSHNKLNGTIPYEFGEAPYLIGFDLSYNDLTGPIPTSFNRSSPSQYLSLLNLSNNRLTFCPSTIRDLPFYIAINGICDFRHQKDPWTRPYDCGCHYDAFDGCRVDYPLEVCVPCVGPPPSSAAEFECQHGAWVLVGPNPSLTNVSIVIEGSPTIIPGNFTSAPVTFQGLDGVLNVAGCATITNITLVLSLEDIQRLMALPEGDRRKLLVQSGTCDLGNIPLQIVNPSTSCATVTASTDSSGNSFSALFKVDNSKCAKSKWWVILLAVLASVAVLTVAAGLTWYLIRRNKQRKASFRASARSDRATIQ